MQIVTSSVACILMHLLGTDKNGTRFVQEDLDRVVSASMCPSNAALTPGLSDTKYTKTNESFSKINLAKVSNSSNNTPSSACNEFGYKEHLTDLFA